MDGYPSDYVAHNVPLIVLSGLTSQALSTDESKLEDLTLRGIRITSEIPEIGSENAVALLDAFHFYDQRKTPWNGKASTGPSPVKIRSVGRDFYLPPRRAQAPDDLVPPSPGLPGPVLHSELSPLTPGSKVFPDGLLPSAWLTKHQLLTPSIYVVFYTLTSNPKLATLHDNQVKTDIIRIQSIFSRNGYKTRVVAVLLGDGISSQTLDVEERLGNIRRAAGLDSKMSFFFVPSGAEPEELQRFVGSMLLALSPLWQEYYRDLTKHARRKKGRSVIPPPTAPPTSGTSQTLSSQGWNVRYDFKLGTFAEFRQEMDVAVRSYEGSYMTLLGNDVFEAIASWSPRWNEARMLSDVLAVRIIRCHLWTGNTTSAARFWKAHKDRICDLVDRRGRGSSTYGWEAWEARWAKLMAELISMADFDEFSIPGTVYLPIEKALVIGERSHPWENLHHPGYWYRESSIHQYKRRTLALNMPEEDRQPPGASPASQLASKAYTYDSYLAPEPHEEYPLPGYPVKIKHSELIQDALESSIAEFSKRGQHRLAAELTMQSARECINNEDWGHALRKLRPLWQKLSFRQEGWLDLVEELGWMLRTVAAHAGDGGTVISIDWELMHKNFSRRPKWHYDLTKSLLGLDTIKTKPVVVLRDNDVLSFLETAFAFEKPEGKVGEAIVAQFSVTSNAQQESIPTTMSEIKIVFEGGLRPVILRHAPASDEVKPHRGTTFIQVALKEEASGESSSTRSSDDLRIFKGQCDLTFKPGQRKVFEFRSPLREPGQAQAHSSTLSLAHETFDLEFITLFGDDSGPMTWWTSSSSTKRFTRSEPVSLNILPKPPKMKANFIDVEQQYYCNENICLKVEVVNDEEDDADATVQAQLIGDEVPKFALEHNGVKEERTNSAALPQLHLGKIPAGKSMVVNVTINPAMFPSIFEFTTKISYNLLADPDTPISCISSAQLSVANAFEANYDFYPRIHPDPFPSFFTHDEVPTKEQHAALPSSTLSPTIASAGEATADSAVTHEDSIAAGVSQKWCLSARYCSFAHEALEVEDLSINVLGLHGGIKCSVTKADATLAPAESKSLPLQIQPKTLEQTDFSVIVQKLSLDDRRSASLDFALAIKWRRISSDSSSASPSNTTILPIPRLLVHSSEPRVLAAATYSSRIPSLIHLSYTIENPSMHFLTFSLTMELSESFAFSGPKQSSIQILPLSRHTIRFRVLPNVRGVWIEPVFVVRDRYFQKVLKVLPTDGMKSGEKGVCVWVPVGEEGDESEEVDDESSG